MLEKPRHVSLIKNLRDIMKSKEEEIFGQKISMRETCLGFSNIEEFYQRSNFGCFCWIKKNIKAVCCAYQNLCMTFTKHFGFLLNFLISWKNCVKEQWPKKSLFYLHFWLNVMICDLRQKRGWNVLRSLKSW